MNKRRTSEKHRQYFENFPKGGKLDGDLMAPLDAEYDAGTGPNPGAALLPGYLSAKENDRLPRSDMRQRKPRGQR